MSCPFRILQIPRGSSAADVKKAYISKVKQYHPDRLRLLSKTEQNRHKQVFLQVQDAYQQITSGKFTQRSTSSSNSSNFNGAGAYAKESERDIYWKRRAHYAKTGLGENKPIYGPNTLVMLGVLGIAGVIGYFSFQQKLRFLKQRHN